MRRSVINVAAIILLGIALGGCTCVFFCENPMNVQRAYVDSRNDCQGQAEKKISLYFSDEYEQTISLKERNAGLLALFSQCMHARDWGVTAPKREIDQPNLASVEEAQQLTRTQAVPNTPAAPGYPAPLNATPQLQSNGASPLISGTQQTVPTQARSGPLAGVGVGPSYDATPSPEATRVEESF